MWGHFICMCAHKSSMTRKIDKQLLLSSVTVLTSKFKAIDSGLFNNLVAFSMTYLSTANIHFTDQLEIKGISCGIPGRYEAITIWASRALDAIKLPIWNIMCCHHTFCKCSKTQSCLPQALYICCKHWCVRARRMIQHNCMGYHYYDRMVNDGIPHNMCIEEDNGYKKI